MAREMYVHVFWENVKSHMLFPLQVTLSCLIFFRVMNLTFVNSLS